MDHSNIIRMANQIAAFFNGAAHDQATKDVAEHINKFWEPRMRMALFGLLEKGGAGLDPTVRDAAPLIRRPKADVA